MQRLYTIKKIGNLKCSYNKNVLTSLKNIWENSRISKKKMENASLKKMCVDCKMFLKKIVFCIKQGKKY